MTTTTLTPSAPAGNPRASRTAVRPVTFGRVVAAEWVKFRTVRSTAWSIATYLLLMVGVPLLLAWATTLIPEGEAGGALPTLLSSGFQKGQLVVVVLGVLAVTSEYATGLVRTTFAAVPRRVPALAAKAVVLAAVAAVVTVVAQGLAFLVTLPFHDRIGATFDLGAEGTWRTLVGLPLYMVAIALLGLAVGALVRHSAGAITIVVALLLVVENVIMIIPFRVFELISPFLPSTAGSRVLADPETLAMMNELTNGAHLGPWQGYGVLLAWVAALGAAAVVLVRSRDA